MIRHGRERTLDRPHLYASYFPPSEPSYDAGHAVRLRFLLNAQGWAIAVMWSSQELLGLPGRAGITWSVPTRAALELWTHLADSSNNGIDGVAAYDAAVADSRGVRWSRERTGTGRALEAARRWLLGVSDEVGSIGPHDLPPRAMVWTEGIGPGHSIVRALDPDSGPLLELRGTGHRVIRQDGVWVRGPAGPTMTCASGIRLAPGIVRIFDKLGPSCLTDELIWSGFSDAEGTLPTPEELVPPSSQPFDLVVAYDDAFETVFTRALFLHTSERTFLRGEGHWWPMPANSGLAVNIDILSPEPDFVPVWDAHERADRHGELFDLARAFEIDDEPVGPTPADPRDVDHFLATNGDGTRSPFLVAEVEGEAHLAVGVRRHHGGLLWTDPNGTRIHFADAPVVHVTAESMAFYDERFAFHLTLRELQQHHAEWLLPSGSALPGSVDALVRQLQDLHRSYIDPAHMIPSTNDCFLIDQWAGFVLGDAAVVVPEPPGKLFDRLQHDDEACAAYADEFGMRLLVPGSPGIPLADLEDSDQPLWVIDPEAGVVAPEAWHLRFVRITDRDLALELVENPDAAAEYARQYGDMPVVPVPGLS